MTQEVCPRCGETEDHAIRRTKPFVPNAYDREQKGENVPIAYDRKPSHFVSESCEGESCSMYHWGYPPPANHKVGEEIAHDDPLPGRHNLTAYVCCSHYRGIFGSAVPCSI